MPEELEPDDELQILLDQLDEEEVPEVPEPEEPVEELEPEQLMVDLVTPPEKALRPVDELTIEDSRQFDDSEVISPVATEAAPEPTIKIEKYLEKLDDVTDDVLASCRADRQETQDVINTYKKAVDDALSHGNQPSRMWVDGLTKAVEVKAGINTNAVKMMEACAKMLAATKAGSVNTQVNIGGGDNLDDVLTQGLSDDDD